MCPVPPFSLTRPKDTTPDPPRRPFTSARLTDVRPPQPVVRPRPFFACVPLWDVGPTCARKPSHPDVALTSRSHLCVVRGPRREGTRHSNPSGDLRSCSGKHFISVTGEGSQPHSGNTTVLSGDPLGNGTRSTRWVRMARTWFPSVYGPSTLWRVLFFFGLGTETRVSVRASSATWYSLFTRLIPLIPFTTPYHPPQPTVPRFFFFYLVSLSPTLTFPTSLPRRTLPPYTRR